MIKSSSSSVTNEVNPITYYSVPDRFMLRYRYAQHATRSLMEKQALLTFFYLQRSIDRSFLSPIDRFILHPLKMGRRLISRVDKLTDSSLPFEKLIDKQKRVLVPYLADFAQIINRYTGDSGNLVFVGHACNLRQLPEKKLLQDRTTAQMFSFSVNKCITYLPFKVEVFRVEDGQEDRMGKIMRWFNFITLSPPDIAQLSRELLRPLSSFTDAPPLPFALLIQNLNVALVAQKISPHVALPYHLYAATSLDTSYQDDVKQPRTTSLWSLASEYPELSLKDYFKLDPEIAQNPGLYQQWVLYDRPTLGQILTPIFVLAYTLYIYSLFQIREKPLLDSEGSKWVAQHVRAQKIDPHGYWSYYLPPVTLDKRRPVNVSEMKKFIPNYGVFWLLTDFSIFEVRRPDSDQEQMSEEEKRQQQQNKFIQQSRRGLLYHALAAIIEQVRTWDRRRNGTAKRSTVASMAETHLGDVEMEVGSLSLHEPTSTTQDLIDRLTLLQTFVSKPFFHLDPLNYRIFLDHTFFLSWNTRPGGLEAARRALTKQVSLSLQDFERNCLLRNQLSEASQEGRDNEPMLETLELDRYGWTFTTPPVRLPPAWLAMLFPPSMSTSMNPAFQDAFPFDTTREFEDPSMRDLLSDAQQKADLLSEADKFWDALRRISHLYLRDSYEDLRLHQGEESWNPTIPRNRDLQSNQDCLMHGYSVLDEHEGQDWYAFLERELLSRTFRVDMTHVSKEIKDLAARVAELTKKYGPEFAQKFKARLFDREPQSGNNTLFPFSVEDLEEAIQEVVVHEEKSRKENPDRKRAAEFEALQKKFLPTVSTTSSAAAADVYDDDNKRSPTELTAETRKMLSVDLEKLEKVFPDLLSLITLLPDVMRNQILNEQEDEEATPQDQKRQVRDRVIKLQKGLADVYNEQLVEDYPVPPGRRPWITPEEREALQRANELSNAPNPIIEDLTPIVVPSKSSRQEKETNEQEEAEEEEEEEAGKRKEYTFEPPRSATRTTRTWNSRSRFTELPPPTIPGSVRRGSAYSRKSRTEEEEQPQPEPQPRKSRFTTRKEIIPESPPPSSPAAAPPTRTYPKLKPVLLEDLNEF